MKVYIYIFIYIYIHIYIERERVNEIEVCDCKRDRKQERQVRNGESLGQAKKEQRGTFMHNPLCGLSALVYNAK